MDGEPFVSSRVHRDGHPSAPWIVGLLDRLHVGAGRRAPANWKFDFIFDVLTVIYQMIRPIQVESIKYLEQVNARAVLRALAAVDGDSDEGGLREAGCAGDKRRSGGP